MLAVHRKRKSLNITEINFMLNRLNKVKRMTNKLIRDMDDEVWNQFAGMAKVMRTTVGKLLTLILKEHLEKNNSGSANLGNNVLDVALSLKDHEETMWLSRLLARRLVNNALQDFSQLKTRVEKNFVSFNSDRKWEKLSDYGLNKIFDTISDNQKKVILALLLEQMTMGLAFMGKNSLQQIRVKNGLS